jgi:hypothetical protein
MALGISMVLCLDDKKPSVADVTREFATHFPDMPPATDVEEKDITMSFRIRADDIILAQMPAPFPWSDLEGPCATSILWKNAAAEIKEHKIHWIVTINAELEPIPLSERLTQATVALMAACPSAIGVYWGNATLVVPKALFTEFAQKIMPLGPPLHIWIDFRVGRDSEKSSSGFTAGMAALGHMELETQKCPEPPHELRQRFEGLIRYVLENGPVIKDGDTIGEDANERIRVVYSKSAFGHKDQVMRLEYETASDKKPWWKLW